MSSSIIVIVLALASANPTNSETPQTWPAFRGNGTSITTSTALPLTWGAESNIGWKVDLRGYGQSSPVIYDSRVFVTSVEGESKETDIVACYDLVSGDPLWEKTFSATQQTPTSNYVSKAAPTPVVDGDRVYAFFESGDMIALSHDGELQWQRSLTTDYGKFIGNHGLGCSPALTEDSVVLLIDHDGPSYLVALDKKTGENRWKVDREPRTSWSSPIIASGSKGTEILISSNGLAEAYQAGNGERLWFVDGLDKNTIASPTVTRELVMIGSSNQDFNWAIRRDGTGNVSESHIAWKAKGVTSSFGSPLAYGDYVYYVNRSGVAFAVDLKSGDVTTKQRLPGSCWASPIGAGDRIYFFTKSGSTAVLSANGELKELAINELPTDDTVYGVAAVQDAFVVRTGSRLTKISAGK